MSAEPPPPAWTERRQPVARAGHRPVVPIAALTAGVVSVLDPERGEEAAVPEPRLRPRFDYTGLGLHERDADAAPSASRPPRCAASSGARRQGRERWPRSRTSTAWRSSPGSPATLALRGEIAGTREAGDA